MTVTNFKQDTDYVAGEGVNGPFEIHVQLKGAEGVTAVNYGQFYIANRKVKVLGVKEVHGTPSTSGTLQVERLQGTEAKGAGDNLLTGTISLSGIANTVVSGTMVATNVTTLEVGDRLGLVNGGTLTSLADVAITVLVEAVD